MSVTDLWTRIVLWLTEHAPVTADALRSPHPSPDVPELEREFQLELPGELHEWWGCCGGTADGVLADVLPPFYTPYGPAKAMESWHDHRQRGAERWQRSSCDYYAGSAGSSFHPAWIPIAGDGFSDELVVDLRPGALHGCVLEWEHEAGRVQRPEWSSVQALLSAVHQSFRDGSAAGHSYPKVTEDGRLDWQIR